MLLALVCPSGLSTGPVSRTAFQRAGIATSVCMGSCIPSLSPQHYPPELLAALGQRKDPEKEIFLQNEGRFLRCARWLQEHFLWACCLLCFVAVRCQFAHLFVSLEPYRLANPGIRSRRENHLGKSEANLHLEGRTLYFLCYHY